MSFKIASKFRDAAVVINSIPVEKYPLLLNRVVQKLHIRNARLFTVEEEAQLKSLFSLSEEDLQLTLNGCCYIFEQAAFASISPEKLYEILLDTGFDEAHAKVLGKVWAAEAASFIGKLKSRTLGGSTLLSSDYRLNLMMGTGSLTKLHEQSSIFEFSVNNAEASDEASTTEKFDVEFSHSELYDFFLQLERVQKQLDGLSTV